MTIRSLLSLVLLLTIFYGCSASKDDSTKDDEVYVFDDMDQFNDENKNSQLKKQEPEPVDTIKTPKIKYNYIIQLGAFTTSARAEQFVTKNAKKTNYPMMTIFDDNLNYYLVQLPVFQEREQADRVLRTLIENNEFNDSFIKSIPVKE